MAAKRNTKVDVAHGDGGIAQPVVTEETFEEQTEGPPDAFEGKLGGAAEEQIERLAQFIMEEIPGEPSQDEGAVDTAIRIMRMKRTVMLAENSIIARSVEEFRSQIQVGRKVMFVVRKDIPGLPNGTHSVAEADVRGRSGPLVFVQIKKIMVWQHQDENRHGAQLVEQDSNVLTEVTIDKIHAIVG